MELTFFLRKINKNFNLPYLILKIRCIYFAALLLTLVTNYLFGSATKCTFVIRNMYKGMCKREPK